MIGNNMLAKKLDVKIIVQTSHEGKTYGVGATIEGLSENMAKYFERIGSGEIIKPEANRPVAKK